MDIIIRPAQPKDIPLIVELASECVIASISPMRDILPSQVKEYRRKDLDSLNFWFQTEQEGIIFVAETKEGKFCGHIIVVVGNMDTLQVKQGWIIDLSVKSSFRKQGVGKSLMMAAEEWLIKNKIKWAVLGVTTANKTAVDFYHKLGYKTEYLQLIKKL